MNRIKEVSDRETLSRRWQERCAQGAFSAAVLGVGTVRIFGKAGDAQLTFPRIESLAALDMLEADERWALDAAQETIRAARARRRPVVAAQPGRSGSAPETM